MKPRLILCILIHGFGIAFGDSYDGRIGTIPIWMDLTYSPDGKAVEGSYFYQKIGKTIPVRGAKDGARVTLRESDKSGNIQAFFTGMFDGDAFRGRWGRSETDSVYAVSLTKSDPALRIQAKKYKPLMTLDAAGRKSKSGKILFDRETLFDGKGYGWLNSAHRAWDGYIIPGANAVDPVLIHVDWNGIKTWEKSYRSTKGREMARVGVTRDHGYVLSGRPFTDSIHAGYVLKVGPNGEEVWNQLYEEMVEGVVEVSDGFILAGCKGDTACLLKTDAMGNVLRRYSYPKMGMGGSLRSLIETSSGYLAVGYCRDGGINYGWVCRLDKSFEILSDRIYDKSTLFLSDLVGAGPNEYLVTGMINTGDTYHAYLMSIDSMLGVRWKVTVPGGDNELHPSIVLKGNTVTLLSGNGGTDATWISKVDIVLPKAD